MKMLNVSTLKELEMSKFLRQKYIFDQASLKDPYLWTFEKKIIFILFYIKELM